MIILSLLANLAASPTPASPPESAPATDVVVVARNRKCRVQLKGVVLSERELDAYATQWAQGERVKVHVPSNASYKCLAEIMFKLEDHGVIFAEFVDERTAP